VPRVACSSKETTKNRGGGARPEEHFLTGITPAGGNSSSAAEGDRKSCSSSEVASRIEGVLRHCTDMEVHKNYADTHGQSECDASHAITHNIPPTVRWPRWARI